ncbi:MAG TPA: hypothetical protein VNK82_07215 [Terriglobales bacterium]|nr:hypothetical protein [Terriglobales bacterium]
MDQILNQGHQVVEHGANLRVHPRLDDRAALVLAVRRQADRQTEGALAHCGEQLLELLLHHRGGDEFAPALCQLVLQQLALRALE